MEGIGEGIYGGGRVGRGRKSDSGERPIKHSRLNLISKEEREPRLHTHLVMPIRAMTMAAASWSKLAAMWLRLVAASAQLRGGGDHTM